MNKKKELLVQIMWELAGSIFYAIGIYNFALQAEFPMTGFSGISIILYRLFNISIGLSTVLLNIPKQKSSNQNNSYIGKKRDVAHR